MEVKSAPQMGKQEMSRWGLGDPGDARSIRWRRITSGGSFSLAVIAPLCLDDHCTGFPIVFLHNDVITGGKKKYCNNDIDEPAAAQGL